MLQSQAQPQQAHRTMGSDSSVHYRNDHRPPSNIIQPPITVWPVPSVYIYIYIIDMCIYVYYIIVLVHVASCCIILLSLSISASPKMVMNDLRPALGILSQQGSGHLRNGMLLLISPVGRWNQKIEDMGHRGFERSRASIWSSQRQTLHLTQHMQHLQPVGIITG